MPPDGNEADYLVGAADLRTVVDQLWLAGAEAVAINDERITTSTAIIDIGGSVLVNAAYLAGPYQISGDRPAGPVLPAVGLARLRGVRPDPARLVRDRDLVGRAGRRRRPGVRRLGDPPRVARGPVALTVGRAPAGRQHRGRERAAVTAARGP